MPFRGMLIKTFREGSFMCTCITYKNGDFYFGRNMDLEYSFGEAVVITPRNFPLHFRHTESLPSHYAMIGMAAGQNREDKLRGKQGELSRYDGENDEMRCFPLYAEAVNEVGLCVAGLNFPGNAFYGKEQTGRLNIASFELIPWILGGCASVQEAEEMFADLNICDDAFSEDMPPAQLHWMLADRERCLVLEAVCEGMHIYENPIGVLTNNPPFEYHRMNLNNYLNVTAGYPKSRFCQGETPSFFPSLQSADLMLSPYSQGMGSIGIPGDFSSASRFVKAAFLRWNSVCTQEEGANISQFFHILDGVAMPRGAVLTQDGKYDITTYACCMNADMGVYYYKTYEDNQIHTTGLDKENLDGEQLIVHKL